MVKVQRILVTCIKALQIMLLGGLRARKVSEDFPSRNKTGSLGSLGQKRKGYDKSLLKLMPQIAARFIVDVPPGGDQTLLAKYNYKIEMEEALKLMIITEQKAT